MKRYTGKKLLILGGKPIGSVELVSRAQELGAYVIVADYLPLEESPAKQIANETWEISTAEIDQLIALCKHHSVSGVLTAVHEFNINRMIDLCERMNYPCYCSRDTWKYCDNKLEFKALCVANDLPIAQKYEIRLENKETYQHIEYPVIVKPVDGSGSRGFRICNSPEEVEEGYLNALRFSPNKNVVVEDYIPYDAVIIHYTMVNGKCIYSGISDKYSAQFSSTGASVMGLQLFPSKGESVYLETLNAKAISMLEAAGFQNGPIWIEAFYNGSDKFIFNEMGYRFGGSLTYYPIKYLQEINQLDLLLDVALGYNVDLVPNATYTPASNYCIIPVHINPGTIKTVEGINKVAAMPEVYAYVPVHFEGDTIENWGSAQQVFCYLHFLFKERHLLKKSIKKALEYLQAKDNNGNNLLYTLFNIETI